MQESIGEPGEIASSTAEIKNMAKAISLFEQQRKSFEDSKYVGYKKKLHSFEKAAQPPAIKERPLITLIVHKQVGDELEQCSMTLNHELNESFFWYHDTLNQISRGDKPSPQSSNDSSGCIVYYKNFMDLTVSDCKYFQGDTLQDCYPLSYRDPACGISASDFDFKIAPPCPNNGLYNALVGEESEPKGFYHEEQRFVYEDEPQDIIESPEEVFSGEIQFRLEAKKPENQNKALYPESSDLHKGASVWKPSSFVSPKRRANKFLQARSALSPLFKGFNLGEISLLVALMFRDERTFALRDYYTFLDSCMFFAETWQTKLAYTGESDEQTYSIPKRRKSEGQVLSEKDIFWGRALVLVQFAISARLKSQGTYFSLQKSVVEYLRNVELHMPDNKLVRSFRAMIRANSDHLDPSKWISAGNHVQPVQKRKRAFLQFTE